jgi:hypothetical protein
VNLVAPRARRADRAGYWRLRRVIAAHGVQRDSNHLSSRGIIPHRQMSVLDNVRAHAARLAASSRFVRIAEDPSVLQSYARSLPLDALRAPKLDPLTHYLDEPDTTLAYLVALDAINFGSGYFPHLEKRAGFSGYFMVAAGLKDAWPMTVEDLRRLQPGECARIFGQTTPDAAVDELLGLFARALNDLGELVAMRYRGSFAALIAASNHSAEQLVPLLAEMPFYRDLGFYKRAQLTAADLSTAGVARFDDLDRLTIFADNLVPHVLRVDGVLEYDADLLARINHEDLVPAGSREEQEIRACALHAVELLRTHLDGITSMQLDYVLWNRGQEPAYKAQPRHRTRTVFY